MPPSAPPRRWHDGRLAPSRRRLPPFLRSPARRAECDSLPPPRELLTLRRGQAGAPVGAIRLRVFHPPAQGRRHEVQFPGDRTYTLAFVEDEADRLLLEFIRELSPA